MFKMAVANNGRTIYCGEVIRRNESVLEVKGYDYNKESRQNMEYVFQVTIDEAIRQENADIKVGDTIVFSMLPGRQNPNAGLAEEIAKLGEAIVIQNDKGNTKIIGLLNVFSKRWNDQHTCLNFSFLNVRGSDKNFIGNPSSYMKNGQQQVAYWMNVATFLPKPDSSIRNNYPADMMDREVAEKTTLAIVITAKQKMYNGSPRTVYSLGKCMKVANPARSLPQNRQNFMEQYPQNMNPNQPPMSQNPYQGQYQMPMQQGQPQMQYQNPMVQGQTMQYQQNQAMQNQYQQNQYSQNQYPQNQTMQGQPQMNQNQMNQPQNGQPSTDTFSLSALGFQC